MRTNGLKLVRGYFLWSVFFALTLVAPIRAENVRFAVLGDTQGDAGQAVNDEAFSRVVQDVLAADPPVQFVIIVGDLVVGTNNDLILAQMFQHWRGLAAPWYNSNFTGLKVYPLPGNHDQQNPLTYRINWTNAFPELPDNGPVWEKKMTYSFDIGPCHLVAVNTSAPDVINSHRVDVDWLEADLKASSQPIKLVFGHEPAYKARFNAVASLDCQQALRDRFWGILTQTGVKAYFCGHDHGYDHWVKDGVHQIITAGGGDHGGFFHYTIVDASDTDATVSIYHEPDNTLYETYKLSETAGVPSEDRAQNDNPYWPYDAPACNWAAMTLLAVGFLTGLSIFPTRPGKVATRFPSSRGPCEAPPGS